MGEKLENSEKIEIEKKDKKILTICGITIWRILAYFIIYSILGYFIETIYGMLTKGVLESRRSFIIGPFCGIYGLGAVAMILALQYFKKNKYLLFLGGFLIGSIVEYLVSLFGETVLNIKWWDYSSEPLNINGRICIFFSLFWGVLAIYLITHVNVKIDKLINAIKLKFKNKFKLLKSIVLISIIFIFLDCVYTGFALQMFYTRLETNYKLDLRGTEKYAEKYTKLYNNKNIKNFVDKYLNDEVILRTFPNLRVLDKDGNMIYIDSVIKTIKPYYIKLYDAR